MSLNSSALMNEFLQTVEKRAWLTARMATKDADEALDIVQDAMLALAVNYAKRPADEWGALFNSILYSKINDWHRRNQVRRRWRVFARSYNEDEEDHTLEPDEGVAQTLFLEPDQQLSNDQLGAKLIAWVEQLPLRQQQALILRAWEGYSIEQTAHIMGCSEGSVKTHFSRATRYLREKLGEFR